jgi:hypothetical protein
MLKKEPPDRDFYPFCWLLALQLAEEPKSSFVGIKNRKTGKKTRLKDCDTWLHNH